MMHTVRPFVAALWREHRRAMLLVAAASLALMLTEGAGLLMLVPLLRLVGVSLDDGASDRLAASLESALRTVGVTPTLVGVLVAMVAVVAVRAAVQWALTNWRAALEASVVGQLRTRLFATVVAMPWARFAGERPAALVHAIGPQVDDVHSALLMILEGVALMAAISAATVVALLVSPALTALVAVAGVALLLAARWLRAPGRVEGERLLDASRDLFALISELLGGIKMIHAHGAERRAEDSVGTATRDWTTLTTRYAARRATVSFVLAVLGAALLAVLVWGGVRVAGLSPASLLLLLVLYARIVPRVSELQALASATEQSLASFRSITALLARAESAPPVAAGGATPPRGAPSITVDALTVRYPDAEHAALERFSAQFPAGRVTVVVGPSGAGKTTLGDVLLGLLVPETGAVRVDGVPLRELAADSWRERVGYLAQEPMLFHGTIRENLLFAKSDASERELHEALDAAACDFVTRLPRGLDAPVGDRGVMLSGGERQRLALARALVRRPDLLVLDEATSALDAEAEQRILATVAALEGRCTVVFCTHREAVRAVAAQVIRLEPPR